MSNSTTIDLLMTIDIFSCFSKTDLAEIIEKTTLSNHKLGENIISQGDPAKGIYVIKSGRIRIFEEANNKEKSLGILSTGDTFGEISILKDHQFDFSARAAGKSEILFFPSESIVHLLHKKPDYASFIKQFLALKLTGGFVSKLFDLKQKMDREQVDTAVRSVGAKRVQAGQTILQQEATEDRRLYVIRDGEVKIIKKDDGKEAVIKILGPGEIFGEKACLEYATQPFDIRSTQETTLIIIPTKTVHTILKHNPGLRSVLEERIGFLNKELERQRKVSKLKLGGGIVSSGEKSGFGSKVLKRFELVQQAEEMDCGAACLSMICKHYKIPITLGKLREMANVTTEGATMDSLAHAGEALGFSTKGVRCTFKTLLSFKMPFIAHWQGYHYIIIYGLSKNHVWVADPGEGFKKLTVAEFEHGWTGNCLQFEQTTAPKIDIKTSSPWNRFVGYIKPQKKILRDLFIAALVIQLLGLSGPIVIQNILDRVIVHQNFGLLSMMIIGLAIITLFSQLTEFLSTYLSNFMTRKMDFDMMTHFCMHVLSLPVDFFTKRKTGDIMARFQENETIREFMTESSIGTVLNAIMVILYFIVLFKYSVLLTFILLGFTVPLILLTIAITPKYKDYARKTFYAETEAESFLLETLNGAETIKAMAVERIVRRKWEKKYAASLDINFKSEMFTSTVGVISELLKAATSITILYIGAQLVLKQELSIGQMMAYNALVGSVMSPLLGLVGVWDEFQQALVSLERLGDVLELEPEQTPETMPSRIILPELEGDITCSNLYFRYGSEKSPYILENVNVTIPDGKTVAIVGHSGSGKTTLAKMLVGLYKPTEGSISVGGYDMDSLDMEYYRKHIGYVMQNNLLFAGTLAENIAMGDLNFDQRRVMEVAKLADADGFISNLPLGYEQIVGERGAGLSGGQMQRICIARALYNNPKFLIFDEATSALDGESESLIQKNLEAILKNRTAVIIAHRLSTIQNADIILVLYNGSIAEQGSHEELLQRKGMYYHLIKKQMGTAS